MKKTLLIAGLGIMVFASCQKENVNAPRTEQITRTISVVEPETRSSYTDGSGISLTYTEYMTVNYWTGETDAPVEGTNTLTAVTGGATPDAETKTWSFTHDAVEGETYYNYQFILPYNSTNVFNSKKTGAQIRLSPIQYPGGNTFDPSQDYLVGQTQLKKDLNTVDPVLFKRLFVPFKLALKGNDIKNKTYTAVTFEINQPATAENCLSSVGYVNTNPNYNYKTFSTEAKYKSNSVTAMFTQIKFNGHNNTLTTKGGTYNCWFMVKPSSFPAGTTATVSLYTTEGKYSKTVTLTDGVEFKNDFLNRMTISLSNDNFTAGELFTVTSYAKKTNHTSQDRLDISKADFTADVTNSALASTTRIHQSEPDDDKTEVKYTNLEGDKPVQTVRIYTSQFISLSVDGEIAIYKEDGTTELGRASYKGEDLYTTGGYVEISLSEPVSSFIIKGVGKNAWLHISAIHTIPAE